MKVLFAVLECGSSSYRLLRSVHTAKAYCSTPKGGSCCYRTPRQPSIFTWTSLNLTPMPPPPSPAQAGEGERRGGEGPNPMAYAMGYVLSPLTGLRKIRFGGKGCQGRKRKSGVRGPKSLITGVWDWGRKSSGDWLVPGSPKGNNVISRR